MNLPLPPPAKGIRDSTAESSLEIPPRRIDVEFMLGWCYYSRHLILTILRCRSPTGVIIKLCRFISRLAECVSRVCLLRFKIQSCRFYGDSHRTL
ncbi:hypothetical protein CDAR_169101 [Caerostris darwini]|uniref:Uncharacterized protein n=1 Tax=Caerostris darwini TaxID=1538125 RepID=A0AAV4WQI8_9ARAC|nr:hypothetical protein CDAR_169101 [Caerostris darwini]